MPTEETLLYHGKPLKTEPRNTSLHEVAEMLEYGRAVSVHLEPGDGSRYDLLLVPLWATDVRSLAQQFEDESIREKSVMYVFDARKHESVVGAAIERGGYYGSLQTLAAGNEWTMTFLEWWFERQLWPLIGAPGDTGTLHHGTNADCPDVQSGRWTRCLGHAEGIADRDM